MNRDIGLDSLHQQILLRLSLNADRNPRYQEMLLAYHELAQKGIDNWDDDDFNLAYAIIGAPAAYLPENN